MPFGTDNEIPSVAGSVLSDDQVAVLGDIASTGITRSSRYHLVTYLIECDFLSAVLVGRSQRLELTPRAQKLLSELSVGLNEL